MTEKYYTVEQISKMLGIHPKTVQRYIREGRLRAAKIGKSWRVTGHDLSLFTESEGAAAPAEKAGTEIKVSAVADIPVAGANEAAHIASALTAALNAKPPEFGTASLHTQYIGEMGVLRVMLWGGIRFTEVMMGALAALTEREEEYDE